MLGVFLRSLQWFSALLDKSFLILSKANALLLLLLLLLKVVQIGIMGTSICQVTLYIMFFMLGSGEKQLKIEELSINVYQDVCRKLNIPNPGRDYKTLAGELGYNTEKVKEFEQEKNPAGAVLSHWGTESGNTVNKLIEILKRMGNDVVAEKLERALGKISTLFLMNH